MVAMSHQQPGHVMHTAWTCLHGLKRLSDDLFTPIDPSLLISQEYKDIFPRMNKNINDMLWWRPKEKKNCWEINFVWCLWTWNQTLLWVHRKHLIHLHFSLNNNNLQLNFLKKSKSVYCVQLNFKLHSFFLCKSGKTKTVFLTLLTLNNWHRTDQNLNLQDHSFQVLAP